MSTLFFHHTRHILNIYSEINLLGCKLYESGRLPIPRENSRRGHKKTRA
jgi:hypothetical protein